jgi:cbb3-type cytochrome oxidase maturation protein
MNEATVALIVMSVLIFLIFLGFLIWGIKSGQFKGVEEAKYQLFKTVDGSEPDAPEKPSEGEKKC